jgi:hypothetical protein
MLEGFVRRNQFYIQNILQQAFCFLEPGGQATTTSFIV